MSGKQKRNASSQVLLLRHEQLVSDPENPRRFYPQEDLQKLAQSIRQAGGVDQAMIVTPLEGTEEYLVVDGNLRLAAARSLGEAAPPLKCEVRRGLDRREKLLIMARTSTLWFAKDPISEARHYRRLIDEEGMTQAELARELGCSLTKIAARLKLLELDPEIQELVARGRLPKMPEVVDAFATVPDGQVRLQLARELARRGASVRSVVKACQKLTDELERVRVEEGAEIHREDGKAPSIAIAAATIGKQLPKGEVLIPQRDVRMAARQACEACEVKEGLLQHVREPAWTLITHAAGETCDLCSLRDVRDACLGCPLPEFLVRMAKIADRREEVEQHERHA